jgi:phosphatidylglycerol---prolipoprotein diacylglyceryl transferase
MMTPDVWPAPYVLVNGLGLIAGLFLLDARLARRAADCRDTAYVLFVFAIVAGWASAHLFDAATRGLAIREAGFTFYGGLLGGTIVYVLLAARRIHAEQIGRTLECAVIPLVLAHAIGRVGCFLAGCCFGTVIGESSVRHPTQLYEAGGLFAIAAFLIRQERGDAIRLVPLYLLAYAGLRFGLEFLRADDRGGWLLFSTSQWVSIALVPAALLLWRVTRGRPALTPDVPIVCQAAVRERSRRGGSSHDARTHLL